MKIQLSEHFTYQKLLRFTLPSIAMMILVSAYSIVDALFVSNVVGELAFSAVGVASPVVYIIGAIGHLVGSGGSSVIARTLGEGKEKEASRQFTLLIIFAIVVTVVLCVLALIFIEPIMRFAGASELLIKDCIVYGRILLYTLPLCVLQSVFSKFLVVLEKPAMGLWVCIVAGVANVVFDYLFIAVFGWGVAGAAYATAIGYFLGAIIPILYVVFSKESKLRFVKTRFNGNVLLETASIGSSATLNSLSNTLIGMLFNVQLMKIAGEMGVAAYGVMLYSDFVFMGIFNGFTIGVSPTISYQYGAGNKEEMKNLFKKSYVFVLVASVVSVVSSQLLASWISTLFVGDSPATMALAVPGFRKFALMYFFSGISVFTSGFFAALCKGRTSFVISLLRSCILKGGLVVLLPIFIGIDGVWLSVVFADMITAVVSVVLVRRLAKEAF